MQAAIARLGARPRHADGDQERGKPHGCRQPEGGDFAIAQGAHDAGEEVLERLAEQGQMLQQNKEV